MDRQAFLVAVDDSWRQFDSAVAGLDEDVLLEPGVVGTWSIKDVLGHVTAWEQMALRHIERSRRGEIPGAETDFSMDAYNASESARRRDWSLAQVQAEVAETRQRLRTTLESMTGEEWQTVVGEGERRQPLGDWVGGALGGDDGPGTHATEHAEEIRAWRQTRESGGDRAPRADR